MATPTNAQLAAALNAAAQEIPGTSMTLYLIVVTPTADAHEAELRSVCNTRRDADRRMILEAELAKFPPDDN